MTCRKNIPRLLDESGENPRQYPNTEWFVIMTTRFTAKQGQYLAFIHSYAKIHGRPPAETDMQRYFSVTPPTVHQMLVKLEALGLIERQPRVARSIKLLLDPSDIPQLI